MSTYHAEIRLSERRQRWAGRLVLYRSDPLGVKPWGRSLAICCNIDEYITLIRLQLSLQSKIWLRVGMGKAFPSPQAVKSEEPPILDFNEERT